MKDYLFLAQKLFIEISEEFELVFENGHYALPDKFKPLCHYLELCLISDYKFTGNKVKDICSAMNTNPKWILGFFHGYKGKKSKYKSNAYIEGYACAIDVKKRKNVPV